MHLNSNYHHYFKLLCKHINIPSLPSHLFKVTVNNFMNNQ